VTPRRSPLLTRRRILTGLGVGLITAGVSDTGAFDSAEAPRTTTIQVADDENAILTLQWFNESGTYESPHEVKVTNKTGTTLSGDTDTNNMVSSDNKKLKFRKDPTESSAPELTLPELPDGESQTFEIVTASGKTGDVSDKVTLSYADPDEISIEVTRDITVSFKRVPPGGLVYAISDDDYNDIRVYNAAKNEELSPPDSTDADVIGSSAADFADDDADANDNDNADIAFASSEDGMYSTEVYGENTIRSTSPSDHNILKDKTRLALAKWPGIDSTNNTGVEPDEYVIIYANRNKNGLYAMNADGDTEKIVSPDEGTLGAAGVANFDNNDENRKQMVFLDGSKELRYLTEDGTTSRLYYEVGDSNETNSIGLGPPASFENFSYVQVPFIDTSDPPSPSLIGLREGEGLTKTTLAGDAKKAPCAPFDVNDDGELEFGFIDSEGDIAYVENVGSDSETDKKLKIGERVNGNTEPTPEPDPSTGLNSGPQTN